MSKIAQKRGGRCLPFFTASKAYALALAAHAVCAERAYKTDGKTDPLHEGIVAATQAIFPGLFAEFIQAVRNDFANGKSRLQ